MVAIITTSTLALSRANVSVVLGIDLIVIQILIGSMIIKEFLRLYFDQYGIFVPVTLPETCRIINIAIVPFLYVFSYVLIYRVFLT